MAGEVGGWIHEVAASAFDSAGKSSTDIGGSIKSHVTHYVTHVSIKSHVAFPTKPPQASTPPKPPPDKVPPAVTPEVPPKRPPHSLSPPHGPPRPRRGPPSPVTNLPKCHEQNKTLQL